MDHLCDSLAPDVPSLVVPTPDVETPWPTLSSLWLPCWSNVSSKSNNSSCVLEMIEHAWEYKQEGFDVHGGHYTRFGWVLTPCLSFNA